MKGVIMKKAEKIFQIKNIRTGDIFVTSSSYQREIDGDTFIGAWKETDPHKRLYWIRKDSTVKVTKNT